MASPEDPLAFVTAGRNGGRIAARAAPEPGAVMAWVDSGATAVVTLLREDEPAFLSAARQVEEAGLVAEAERGWLHLPLSGKNALLGGRRDPDCKKTQLDASSLARVVEVATLIEEGESVVVHCAAGMHRTGTVMYLALRLVGVAPKVALNLIEQSRPVTHEEMTKSTNRHGPLWEIAEQRLGMGFAGDPMLGDADEVGDYKSKARRRRAAKSSKR